MEDRFGGSVVLSDDDRALAVSTDREGPGIDGMGQPEGGVDAPDAGAVYLY